MNVYDHQTGKRVKQLNMGGVWSTVRWLKAGGRYQVEVRAVGHDFRRVGFPTKRIDVYLGSFWTITLTSKHVY